MSEELLTAILKEVTAQGQTLASVKTSVDTLVGAAGQPGRITKIEDDVDSLKESRSYLYGFGAGLVVIEGAFHFVMHKLGLK
jgi:hypothetical protein